MEKKSPFYMMACLSPEAGPHALFAYTYDDPLRAWDSGARFETPPPDPIEIEIEQDGVLPEFADDGIPVMTRNLLSVLQAAGVDNLDTYNVSLTDPIKNKTYNDYVAFNIIGRVAAADMARSKGDRTIPWFDSVSISPDAPRDALFFRLAESSNAIVVHEKIKKRIEDNGIKTLTFISPENWSG